MKTQAPNTSPSGGDGHVAVPKAHTVDGCVEIASRSPGVTLGDQEPLATVEVRTQHSVYRMTVLEPRRGEILIQGGCRWPQPTEGRLLGASFGHGLIKLGSIVCGMRMEILIGGRRIVTSRVLRIEVHNNPVLRGPF